MDNTQFPNNSMPTGFGQNPYNMGYDPNQTVLSATPALTQVSGQIPDPTMIPPEQMMGPAPEEVKNDKIVSLVKTIAIVVLSLTTVTFIGLFIWTFIRYDDVQTKAVTGKNPSEIKIRS